MFDREGNRKYLNWPEREAFHRVVQKEPGVERRAFCLTLFHTGCRISEALNLTTDRVDRSEQSLVFQTLKRRKPGHFRSVPIPESLLRLFDEFGSGQPNTRVWGFARVTGYRLIKAKMAEAGITGAKASPKGLRHSHAIACISKKIPLTTVKKWLGHARLETTAIYVDASGEEERELARRVWTSG
jgi:integrase